MLDSILAGKLRTVKQRLDFALDAQKHRAQLFSASEADDSHSARENTTGKINGARMLLAALIAEAIILTIDFAGMERFPVVSGRFSQVADHSSLVWGFFAAISAIWLGAAARPRFGPGHGAAVNTGFPFWIFGLTMSTLDLVLRIISADTFLF